ncbi:MAG: FkbM family methyltransferase [Candidatus Eremiobacteraeota bacterium]|nr:FkbM family methyltransferase [Candidatus Eremiobacteraeota bacterium]
MEPAVIVALRKAYRRIAGPNASLTHAPRTVLRWIYGPDFTVKLRGKPFTVNLTDAVVSASILVYRKYEELETELMTQLVKPGMRALDLGANIGFFTTLLGELVGDRGRVAAFEPHPNNARLLEKNVHDRGLDGIVTVYERAVGQEPGSAKLFLGEAANLGDFRLRPGAETANARDGVEVQIVRVDDALADWPSVEFAKIDIQGFETPALRGMAKLLERSPDAMLLTEFWPEGQRDAGYDALTFYRQLRELGFSTWEVSEAPRGLLPLDEARAPELIERLERAGSLVNLLCARRADAFAEIRL